MNVLIIGSGGREHAIAWKIAQSSKLTKLFCAPGNPGIAEVATLVPLKVDDLKGLVSFVKENNIELTIVGPEYPLSLGIVDAFRKEKLKIFGPTQSAAELESSKAYAKEVMLASGVATAKCEVVEDLESAEKYVQENGVPTVLKADGLAAGKGVFVCMTKEEAHTALETLFKKMKVTRVVIEDYLTGKEASYIVATDGVRIVPLAASNDYKRIFDNDEGPNTGGMGTVSPTPNLAESMESEVVEKVIKPVLRKMHDRGNPFQGFLYAGLMINEKSEINVIEFNARLGDPETQVIMRRLESDLLEIILALVSDEQVELPEVKWSPKHAVCVVQASDGYPGDLKLGDVITGIDAAHEVKDVIVFHAGTALNKEKKVATAGGRVLTITALGNDKEDARAKAYQAADFIQFRGKQFRRDIGK